MVSGQIDHSPEATMFRAGTVNMLSSVKVVSGQNVRLPLFAFRIDLFWQVPKLGTCRISTTPQVDNLSTCGEKGGADGKGVLQRAVIIPYL